jgi:ssDNA-binding Zn-finger/Zn-ribbon topoisomerase 1
MEKLSYAIAPSCPNCGKTMRKKKSSFGIFWGCQNYPKCTGKKTISFDTQKEYARKEKRNLLKEDYYKFIENGWNSCVNNKCFYYCFDTDIKSCPKCKNPMRYSINEKGDK